MSDVLQIKNEDVNIRYREHAREHCRRSRRSPDVDTYRQSIDIEDIKRRQSNMAERANDGHRLRPENTARGTSLFTVNLCSGCVVSFQSG